MRLYKHVPINNHYTQTHCCIYSYPKIIHHFIIIIQKLVTDVDVVTIAAMPNGPVDAAVPSPNQRRAQVVFDGSKPGLSGPANRAAANK